ncbi:DNA repair protein, partial [Vibrio parahaemolyticus]
MNIDTNLQTNATDLLPKAKLKFEHDLINIGQNPEKGKPFELFYEKYSQAIAEGKPFQNPAQLQTAVGGRYLKAQIAFNVLESQQSNLDHKLREVPEWFTAPLKAALKLDITALWQSVEQDIATVVENRVKIAEHLSEQ